MNLFQQKVFSVSNNLSDLKSIRKRKKGEEEDMGEIEQRNQEIEDKHFPFQSL